LCQTKLILYFYLFGEGAPAEVVEAIALERLAEQGVEGLVGAGGGGAVGGDGEGGDVGHLLPLVLALRGRVQQVAVLQLLGHSLQHGQRLAEVDGQRDLGQLGQVLADAVLHDRPQVEAGVGPRQNFGAPCLDGTPRQLERLQVVRGLFRLQLLWLRLAGFWAFLRVHCDL